MRCEYIGPAFDGSGYGEAARGYIGALSDAGVDVRLRFVSFEQVRPDLGELGEWLVSRLADSPLPDADVRVIHTTPDTWDALLMTSDKAIPTVGYCAWETDSPPPAWVESINRNVKLLLVPSRQNVEAFTAAGVTVPVHRLAHAVRDIPSRRDSTLPREPGRFRFLSIFQWTERKNPLGLLKAYLTEFQPHENVSLVLKTYLLAGGLEERDQVRAWIKEVKAGLWLKDYPQVELIVQQLSGPDIRQLIHDCDAYVSLHRQEGFGLPIVEAMMCGKPVVATRMGGPAEFGLPISCQVSYQETPVFSMPWGHYTGRQVWAEPNLMEARSRMRTVFNDRAEAMRLGEACREAALRDFSPEIIGAQMKVTLAHVAEIARQNARS